MRSGAEVASLASIILQTFPMSHKAVPDSHIQQNSCAKSAEIVVEDITLCIKPG